MPADDISRTLAAVWRRESGRIVGALARLLHDLATAEEMAQEALLAALEHWPEEGLPDNPAAWLMTTAKHRALDRLRQQALHARKQQELGADADALQAHVTPDFVHALAEAQADEIGDDLLRLVFTACHPVLNTEARVALTLKVVGGLATAEIARAFLVPEPTLAQRIVRAKRTLQQASVGFEAPSAAQRRERLPSVLEVVYLIFNEGYAATAGDDWMRPALCDEALRLARTLTQLVPDEPEAWGLDALLAIQASRTPARTGANGEPVLLPEQDRSRWDQALIQRGLQSLQRAEQTAAQRGEPLGPYALQAEIAACHARAATAAQTDWARIVAHYDALLALNNSPVIALNRAVAVGMAQGPEAALALVDALQNEPQLARYHWLPSVRGDLLARLGRNAEAAEAFRRAAGLAGNERERQLLTDRLLRL